MSTPTREQDIKSMTDPPRHTLIGREYYCIHSGFIWYDGEKSCRKCAATLNLPSNAPTREQDHCTTHKIYIADCTLCFDKWLENAEVRTSGYEAVCDDIDAVLATLATPSFDYEWSVAPDALKKYVEREVAEGWWTRGKLAGISQAKATQQSDLQTMNHMMKGRLEQ